MKTINNFLNEAKQETYYVSFNGCQDKTGVPITVTCMVDKESAKEFEEFLKDEEGNTVSHAEGGNIEF